MKKPYTDADLPVKYQLEGRRWRPERARRQEEIARRRSLRSGTLVREQQRDGITFAGDWFDSAKEVTDKRFIAGIIATSLFNSSWHIGAENAPDVMRRRLKLPFLADHETGWRQDSEGLITLTTERLLVASHLGNQVVAEYAANRSNKVLLRRVGNYTGTTALHLAAVEHEATHLGGTAYQVQEGMRAVALDTVERSLTIADEIGVYPTIAQIHNPYSPVGVYIRSEAPDGALRTYDQLLAVNSNR